MKGNRIDDLKEALDKFSSHYEELKSIGLNKEIIEAYLQRKTKLPIKDIRAILECQEEFFDNFIIKSAEEEL